MNFILTLSISSRVIISGGDIAIKFPRTLTTIPRFLHSAPNVSPMPEKWQTESLELTMCGCTVIGRVNDACSDEQKAFTCPTNIGAESHVGNINNNIIGRYIL